MTESSGAGFQFSTRVISPGGVSHLVVFRLPPEGTIEEDLADLFKAMNLFEATMVDEKYLALTNSFNGQDVLSRPPAGAAPQPRPSQPESPGAPEEERPPASTPTRGIKQATLDKYPNHTSLAVGVLTEITVKEVGGGKLRIGFEMTGRSKPIYDQRGPEVVAAVVFGSNDFAYGKLTPAILAKPKTTLDQSDWGIKLYVLSGKGPEYWDVLEVKPG